MNSLERELRAILGPKTVSIEGFVYENKETIALSPQCAPGFSNPNQKVHGIFHFCIAGMYKKDQN